jgi:hypothetical protein
MKYKVGDKVRVKSDLQVGETYGSNTFIESMANHFGQGAIITEIDEGNGYMLDIDEACRYTEEMLEKPILAVNYDGSLNLDAKEDLINNPKHYTTGGIETIDFIEAKNLNFRLANAVKYLTRAEHKGSKLSDLKKAIWYIQREIDKSESAE